MNRNYPYAPDVINATIATHTSPSVDAFSRWRVSNPTTIFDSKQIFDNQPLFWDEELESGADITSTHSVNKAATTITSTINTAGVFTRQTFRRFNYQPGKSQQIVMTGILQESGGGTGILRRIGYFDDSNGIFIEDNAGVISLVIRSKTSGSVVDTKTPQAKWDDPLNGNGPSRVLIDWSKTQIFFFDMEWLGVGTVRFGMAQAGTLIAVHNVNHANVDTTVYMSTPNLPLRYQMATANPSAASKMSAMCGTVMSEGGIDDTGVLRYKSTSGTHVDMLTENLIYAVVGIQLKTTHLGATIHIVDAALTLLTASKQVEWILVFNPSVAGTFTYADETNSAVRTATGTDSSVVTGGTIITGGFLESGGQQAGRAASGSKEVPNALLLGADISNNVDSIVLAARPINGSSGIDMEGALTWRELS